jgi:hypothetical protein
MTDAGDTENRKAKELRLLAAQFRAKAEETQLANYVDLMRKSAGELERLASQLEAEEEAELPRSRCA